jgi:oxygen-independent coproporphyrinogen-3 oxidase
MGRSQPEDRLGIYVSVPFCRAKCSFCNFASGVGTDAAIDSYVSRLCAEIDAAGEAAERPGAVLPRTVDTIYFGGGTPSLLEPAQLRRIFAAIGRGFHVTADAEITLEAAPGQIAQETLEQAQRLGVNRVSLGVQSFVDRECAAVGRLHTGRDCVQEIARLRAAGCAEVGADLIAGLPFQTAESWAESLDVACGLAADRALTHLSVYMLEVDEDSRLGREVLAGGLRLHAPRVPTGDAAAELYEMACERLAQAASPEAAFSQYEISNFAARGNGGQSHRCRHNMKYWRREPYIGFGLDAHSMLHTAADSGLRRDGLIEGQQAVRFAQPDDLPGYMSGRGVEVVQVGEREAFEETVFLGLRMNEGMDLDRLRSEFPREFTQPCEDAAQELLAEGLMARRGGSWTLTLRGRMVSNEIFGRLLLTEAVA